MMKVDYDPCSKRWFICLPEEPGRPRIEADTPQQLEDFLDWVENGMRVRKTKQLVNQGGA